MYNLQQLEKQQIGLKIPQYLIEEIDNFTKHFSVNRTNIIIEALRSYISEQKENLSYEQEFLNRVNEIKSGKVSSLSTLYQLSKS